MATHKSLTLANSIASNLQARLAGLGSLAVAVSFDTNGNPVLTVGTNVAGTAGAVIRIAPVTWPLATDALGNAAIMYTPDVAQIAMEAEAAVQASWINGQAVRTAILGEVLMRGTEVQLFHSANGTAPSVAVMTGTPDADFQPLQQYAMIANS